MQAQLQMYSGAQSISSSQYFGDGSDPREAAARGGGADEFISKLNLDLNQVSSVAKDVGRRFGDFVNNLNKY
jgi:hypothetical protein